jgi:hypothetical protein
MAKMKPFTYTITPVHNKLLLALYDVHYRLKEIQDFIEAASGPTLDLVAPRHKPPRIKTTSKQRHVRLKKERQKWLRQKKRKR